MSSCAYRTSVWVTPADTGSAIANLSSITEANPVWYTLDASGAIVKKHGLAVRASLFADRELWVQVDHLNRRKVRRRGQ